jgi:hypothetical protein
MSDKPYKISQLEGGLNVIEFDDSAGNEFKINTISKDQGVMYVPKGHKFEMINKDIYVTYREVERPDTTRTVATLLYLIIAYIFVSIYNLYTS